VKKGRNEVLVVRVIHMKRQIDRTQAPSFCPTSVAEYNAIHSGSLNNSAIIDYLGHPHSTILINAQAISTNLLGLG